MDEYVFISYASSDGQVFARRLYADLVAQNIRVWFDQESIPPGSDWDREIDKGLQSSKAVLLLLTPGSVLSHQVKSEWNNALNRYQPLIPLLVKECEIPRTISVFNYLDFRSEYEKNFSALLSRLKALDSEHPKYLLQILNAYESAQSEARDPSRFSSKIETIKQRISQWNEGINDQRTRIAVGIEQQKGILTSDQQKFNRLVTVGQRPTQLTELFKDRSHQRAQIIQLLSDEKVRLLSVIARGGMGKTALVAKVLSDIEKNHESLDSIGNIHGIVYLSVRNAGFSLESIFLNVAKLFEPTVATSLNAVWESTKLSIEEKVENLIEVLGKHKVIVFIDNIEDVLDSTGHVRDPELRAFFNTALHDLRNSKIITTSRNTLNLSPELAAFERRIFIQEGLPTPDGVQLLRDLDPNGSYGIASSTDEKIAELVALGHGIPRALEVMVAILANDPFMDIDTLQSEFVHHENTVHELVAENYRKLDENSQRVIEAIAVYKKPLSILAIDYLLEPFFPGLNVPQILRQLAQIRVIDIDRITKTIYLHPIDSDFAYHQIPNPPSAHEQAYCLRNLENRAADYYSSFHKAVPWSHLDDVQSYLDAYEHRIKASEYDKAAVLLGEIANFLAFQGHVFRLERMLKSIETDLKSDESRAAFHYCSGLVRMVLGPLEAAITNLEKAHKTAAPHTAVHYNSLKHLGDAYRYSGQLNEAVKHLEHALELVVDFEDKIQILMNLSMTYTSLWDIAAAIRCAENAVEQSIKSDNIVTLAKAHNALAVAYVAARKDRAAIEHGLKSLEYYKAYNEQGGRAVNGATFMLQLLGMCYLELGNTETAFEYFETALTNTLEFDLPRVRGFVLFNTAVAHLIAGQLPKAIEAARQAQKLFTDLGIQYVDVSHLVKAVSSRIEGDTLAEANEWLRCAHETIKTPDLFNPLFFAELARKTAEKIGNADLMSEAQRFVDEFRKKLVTV
ncbi:MAG: TIR domain-containing protein [Anaerolineae bacterium]|nr:TIR domain-containing protein [Anaerolineae bacterium]